MIYIILTILLFCSIFVVAPPKTIKKQKVLLLFGGMLLIIISATWGNSSDYKNYIDLYYNVTNGYSSIIVEPSFIFISQIAAFFGTPIILFFIYSLIGVSLKLIAIKKLTSLWFLSLIIYIANFYILQEATQIRVGIATGFLLLSIIPIYEKKIINFFLLFICALFFHYSAIIMLPLYFLSKKPYKLLLATAIPLGIMLYFFHIDLLTIRIPIVPIQEKIDMYNLLKENEEVEWISNINVFNLLFLLRVFIFYLLLWKYNIISKYNKYFPILIKIYCLSLFSFLVLASSPVMAFRISEFYGIVEIILIPFIAYIFKPLTFSKLAIISLSFLFVLLMLKNNII